jgi:hypothetical protein
VAYANNGSCDDVCIDVGNWDNQNEDYDEERADNEVGAKNARVDVKIDAKAAAGSETGENKKEDVAVRRKIFFISKLVLYFRGPGTCTGPCLRSYPCSRSRRPCQSRKCYVLAQILFPVALTNR